MTTFAQSFDFYYSARRDYNSYLATRGYYSDNGVIRWEPTAPVDVEPEKRFGPGAATRGEIDDYDWSDSEEF